MTHSLQSNNLDQLVQLLAQEGFDGMAEAITILMNEAMKLERSEVLQAAPYQRCEGRRGYANGFKPKTVASRLGKLQLAVPQTRGVEFYPSALERGERSERALKLAMAEMYVQGVSTRKVQEVTRELCGFDVSSSQVSRATQLLDDELDEDELEDDELLEELDDDEELDELDESQQPSPSCTTSHLRLSAIHLAQPNVPAGTLSAGSQHSPDDCGRQTSGQTTPMES